MEIKELITTDVVFKVMPDYLWRRYTSFLKKRMGDKFSEYKNNAWSGSTAAIYLHGQLEEEVGFDCATIVNSGTVGVNTSTVWWSVIQGNTCEEYSDTPVSRMHFNGIARCKVPGGYGDAIGFFRTKDEHLVTYDKGTFPYWKQRGLIVMANDKKAIADAYERYLSNTL